MSCGSATPTRCNNRRLGSRGDSVWGAEIDALWMPLDGLTLGTAVSWMETEIGEFIGSNQVGDEINFNGSEFPLSSNWGATATAKYEWNLTSNLVID